MLLLLFLLLPPLSTPKTAENINGLLESDLELPLSSHNNKNLKSCKTKLISATPSAWLSTLFPCLTANKASKISSPFRNSITTSDQGYKRTDYVPQVLFSKTSKKNCTANNIPASPIAPIIETPSLLQPEKIPCGNGGPTNFEKTFQDVRDKLLDCTPNLCHCSKRPPNPSGDHPLSWPSSPTNAQALHVKAEKRAQF
jgi:hypothetical protein